VPDSATIRARRTAERAPDVAPAPPPSRSIDQVHDVLGRLRDAEASFRQSVAQIEAAKSSGKPRPAAPAASDGGLDELLGSSGDRPKLKRR
jgi:hypothetical protein